MKCKIMTYPENADILTKKSEQIKVEDITTERIQNIITDLKDTLNSTEGVGISAIQIGLPYKICLIKHNGKITTMINPTIVRTRGETSFQEGCLSAPGTYRKVKRFQKVWCEYLDETGKQCEVAEGGLKSIIIQHELDHFDGWCEVFNEITKEEQE